MGNFEHKKWNKQTICLSCWYIWTLKLQVVYLAELLQSNIMWCNNDNVGHTKQYWAGVDGVDGDGECDITVFVNIRYFGVQSSQLRDRQSRGHIPLLSSLVRLVTGQVTPSISGYSRDLDLGNSSQILQMSIFPSQVESRLFILLKTDIEAAT